MLALLRFFNFCTFDIIEASREGSSRESDTSLYGFSVIQQVSNGTLRL